MFDCSSQINVCHGEHINCGCVIDTSPDRLETEFHQWLKSAPENLETSCYRPDVCGRSPCFMPSYPNSFCLPPNVMSDKDRPYINQYNMSIPRTPYSDIPQQPLHDAQLDCTTFQMEKIQISSEADYSKIGCMVTSNIPGSSYPVNFPAKKVFKKRSGNVKCSKGVGTNLYGRFYCPGRPLDMDVREEIIRLFQQNMKVNQISKILKISHGCVSKIIKRYKLTGNVSPASSPEQRRPRRTKKASLPISAQLPTNDNNERLKFPYQQYSLQKTYSFQ